MAETKISDLTAGTVIADDDLFEYVDSSDPETLTGKNKKSTFTLLQTYLVTSTFTKAATVLTKTNTTSFTPSADYHPMTLKFFTDNCLRKTNTVSLLQLLIFIQLLRNM